MPSSIALRVALVIVTIVLAALAIFQAALVLGAPLGGAAWGGQQEVLSPMLRAGSAFAIVCYGVFVWVARRRLAATERRSFRVAAWAIAAYFLLGVILNLASSSPWERFLMAPVALVLGSSFIVIARGR